ncbi:MAG TPA: helix-turn-helix domain-containing protein [Candidatus Limnocylindrales bacterium]
MLRTEPGPAARPTAEEPAPAYHALRSAAGLTLEEGFDQLAEAIRDPTRRRILVEFYRDPTPRTASDVAAASGISRAVARTHLEVLRATGYLRQTVRRGRRGKPAHLYALDTDSPHWLPHPPRQMALLALLVLEAASLGPERVLGLVEQVGTDYGAAIQDLRSDGRDGGVMGALAPLRLLGQALDLEPVDERAREARLTIAGPLFREAAPARPDLVCHLHLGIVRALLDELPVTVQMDPHDPHPAEDACRFLLRRRR